MIRVAAVTLLAFGCATGGTFSTGGDPLPTDPAPPSLESALESEIHQLVNQHRASRRLPELQSHPRVAELAREHSGAMASRRRPFGHEGFEERSATIAPLLPVQSAAENVAYDSRSGAGLASHVVNGWLASSGHRRNIEGSFTHTGIGVAQGPDGVRYFTQIFVNAN